MIPLPRSLLVPALCAALTACATHAPAPPTDTANSAATQVLDDYTWQLDQARDAKGQPITALTDKPGAPLALRFDAGRVSLLNGCNQMGASVTAKGAMLVVGDIASTMMACADDRLMRFDAAAAKALRGPLAWHLQETAPPSLILTNAGDDVLSFVGEATAATRYGGPGVTEFLEVAAHTQPCHDPLISQRRCMLVREVQFDAQGIRTGTPGEFQSFYGIIEGYEHQPGVRNVLRVQRYKIPDPPADASNIAWVLDTVVESEVVDP